MSQPQAQSRGTGTPRVSLGFLEAPLGPSCSHLGPLAHSPLSLVLGSAEVGRKDKALPCPLPCGPQPVVCHLLTCPEGQGGRRAGHIPGGGGADRETQSQGEELPLHPRILDEATRL